jgi:hypothetical protein
MSKRCANRLCAKRKLGFNSLGDRDLEISSAVRSTE